MSYTDTDIITKRYVPEGGHENPTTILEAMQNGRLILAEAGRRGTGVDYKKGPTTTEEDPYSDGWKCCARGAVCVTLIGLRRFPYTGYAGEDRLYSWRTADHEAMLTDEDIARWTLYGKAMEAFHEFTNQTRGMATTAFNDAQADDEPVLKLYDEFIAHLESLAVTPSSAVLDDQGDFV